MINRSSGTMNTGGGTALPARAAASPAATDSATIPNHSTGKTRFRKNVLREEIRLAVSAGSTLLLMLLRGGGDGTAGDARRARSLPGLIELVPHEPAHGDVTHRDQQHAEQRGTQHPADHAGADGVARVGARTARDHHGEHAEDEGERGHEERPEAQACGLPPPILHALVGLLPGGSELGEPD